MTSVPDDDQNTQNHESANYINDAGQTEENIAGPVSPSQDDLALENAIGDAFKQFALFGSEHAQTTDLTGTTDSELVEQDHVDSEEQMKVENTGGFPAKEQKQEQEKEQEQEQEQETSDMDLENAVGNLFSSFAADNNFSKPESKSEDDHKVEELRSVSIEDREANLPPSFSDNTAQPTSSTEISGKQESRELPTDHEVLEKSNHETLDKPKTIPDVFATEGDISESNHQLPAELSATKENPSLQNENMHDSAVQDDGVEVEAETITKSPSASESMSLNNTEPTSELQTGTHMENRHVSGAEEHDDNDDNDNDDDLENAIGDAFKNLVEDMNSKEDAPPPSEAEIANQNELDDQNLEDAIGAAFKSLGGDFAGENQTQTDFPQTASLHELSADSSDSTDQSSHHVPGSKAETSTSFDSHMDIDLGDIVQNVVSQMGDLDHSSESAQTSLISKDILHNLASEISNQVHTAESYSQARETAQSDSQIDVQEEDASQDLDAALKAAVANAMKSAFPSGDTNSTIQESVPTDKESDLEQLQMNEILQNAFNMAMQNPQELFTSMDSSGESGTEELAEIDHSSTNALASATALAAQSVKESSEKSKDTSSSQQVSASRKPSTDNQKPLSIAETLALHRANMSAASQRDYSSIKSLEESRRGTDERVPYQSSPQNHPQLSTILSSLSQHIQSGTHPSNLMSVIRQMTNALMHNKKFPPTFSKSGQELIKNVKNSADDRAFVLVNFQKAKSFIQGMADDENRTKASTLIENILDSIEAKKPKLGMEDPSSIEQFNSQETGDIPSFYDAALSTLSNLDISRLRNTIEGVKPDVDSSEHKIRVREGNRERKKKWREENAERNKDNDLRCRVLKRAALKFGESSSDEKSSWIEKEYTKRRNRRISRQKKDDVKTESPPPSDESPSQDPLLVRKLTDSFNLVSECGFDEEPKAVLMAICATTATVSSSCADLLNIREPSIIVNAITSILGSIFDQSLKSGASRKFAFLIKRQDSQFSSKTPQEMTKEELLRKFSALNAFKPTGSEFSPALSALEALKQSQKRLDLDFVESASKRPKTDISNDYTDSDRHLMNDTGDSIHHSGINSWSTVSNLRMPQYKKPSTAGIATDPELLKMDSSRREFVEPIPKIASPFISNKLGTDLGNYSAPKSFKKPGNLQRPGFSKPTNKSTNQRFPTLYSTSFRSN